MSNLMCFFLQIMPIYSRIKKVQVINSLLSYNTSCETVEYPQYIAAEPQPLSIPAMMEGEKRNELVQ